MVIKTALTWHGPIEMGRPPLTGYYIKEEGPEKLRHVFFERQDMLDLTAWLMVHRPFKGLVLWVGERVTLIGPNWIIHIKPIFIKWRDKQLKVYTFPAKLVMPGYIWKDSLRSGKERHYTRQDMYEALTHAAEQGMFSGFNQSKLIQGRTIEQFAQKYLDLRPGK